MKRIKLKIAKGATVQVIAGADKGKTGPVMEVDSVNLKIKIQQKKPVMKMGQYLSN